LKILSTALRRRLLSGGISPARAATEAGFADQAHLNRWFRRYYGVTPGAYQAAVRSAGTAGERDRRYSQEILSSIK